VHKRRAIRPLAVAGIAALLATLTTAPTGTAATTPYALQIKERPSKIHGNGTVTIKFWLRCAPGYHAFEYSVGVRQQTSTGDVSAVPQTDLLPCDGTRHLHAVHVPPYLGAWTRGFADVAVNVQLHDGGAGGDTSVDASARVWLKR